MHSNGRRNIPLIVGGGINSAEKALANCKAGADIIVVGNCIEKNPSLLEEIAKTIREYNKVKNNEMLIRN